MENIFVNGKSRKFMFINNIMDDVIKYVIAFILGWLISRMMGNGFSVGYESDPCIDINDETTCNSVSSCE